MGGAERPGRILNVPVNAGDAGIRFGAGGDGGGLAERAPAQKLRIAEVVESAPATEYHHPIAERIVWAEIDREARKGKPIPSDHAPLLIDLDEVGHPIDAGWTGATERIAKRRTR